jgi:hypothetical protein
VRDCLCGEGGIIRTELTLFLEIALGGWLALLAALIAIQLFRGRIVTAGLLSAPGHRGIAVTRIQLMVTTVTFAVGYLGAALSQHSGADLPNVPTAMLVALFGSHGVYLGGKYTAKQS